MLTKPSCDTHLVFYEEIDIRTLLFLTLMMDGKALKYLIFRNRLKEKVKIVGISDLR